VEIEEQQNFSSSLSDAQLLRYRKPEEKLWLTVLWGAFVEIGIIPTANTKKISFHVWREAVRWFLDQKSTHGGSFNFICTQLNINKKAINQYVVNYVCPCCQRKPILEPCPQKVTRPPR